MKARNQVEEFLNSSGWEKDRFGHFKKEANGRLMRVKMQAQSLRFEVSVDVSGKKEWMKMGGSYYSKIRFDENSMWLNSLRVVRRNSNKKKGP